MRAATAAAAVTGVVLGVAVGWMAAKAAHDPAAPPAVAAPAPNDAAVRALASRLDGIDRRLDAVQAALGRLAEARHAASVETSAAPAESPPAAATATANPGAPAAAAQRFADVPADDLELEADERHARSHDHAGAVQRYRALVSRGGRPEQIRRWSIRLGDCLTRLGRGREAVDAYRACVEASSEDTTERAAAAGAVAEATAADDPDAALRWLDVALASAHPPAGVYVENWHALAAALAERLGRTDRLAAEREWMARRHGAERR